MFSTKTLCQMFFQTCLKGYKLKKLVVEPKKPQPVESVDRQLNRSRYRSTPNSTDQGYEQ